MERWALVSGLRGDLDLYEQIQSDLQTYKEKANPDGHLVPNTMPQGQQDLCGLKAASLQAPHQRGHITMGGGRPP